MATASASNDDKREVKNEGVKINDEQTQENVEMERKVEASTSQANQQVAEVPRENTAVGRIDAVQSYLASERIAEMYMRSTPQASSESLCTRILEDWPDEEDVLPPVVDFSVEQLTPGWYQSYCASPFCPNDQ